MNMARIHNLKTYKLGISFSIFLFFFSLKLPIAMAQMSEFQGLKIRLVEDASVDQDKVKISGRFSTFVTCGSQYATWFQFPQTIMYSIKDLKTGTVYESINNELSISWDGNSVYEEYSTEPCDQIVNEDFSVFVEDIYFINVPEDRLEDVEITAKYFGYTSNSIYVKGSNLKLRGF